MTRRARLYLAGGLVLQGAAAWLLFGPLPAWLAALAHLAGAALWGVGFAARQPSAPPRAWLLPAGCAALFPLLGPLAAVFIADLQRRPPADQSASRYVVWDDESRSRWSGSTPAGATGQSIVDILQSPRTQLRRNAVLALRDLDPAMAIPLLRKGLQDSDEQVRIYAQNILSTMLEGFETGIKALEQRLASSPDGVAHAVRLAEQYFELVYLDIAGDEETAAHYLARAQSLLTRAAALAPEHREIAFLGLKYALRARDVPAAQRWFDQLRAVGFDLHAVLPWQMELVFLQRDWRRLEELFVFFQRAQILNPRIADLRQFWLGSTATAP